ncbi:MAG: hypothetical protein V9G22_15720 [Ottowia sp.]
MLILLGALNLAALRRRINAIAASARRGPPSPPREEVGLSATETGTHEHTDALLDRLDGRWGRLGVYGLVRPAHRRRRPRARRLSRGGAAVLSTIRDPRWAIADPLVFGAGTIAGMLLITAALALPFAYTARRFARTNHALCAGLRPPQRALFGVFLVYHIGFVDGLFTAHPSWTPG